MIFLVLETAMLKVNQNRFLKVYIIIFYFILQQPNEK